MTYFLIFLAIIVAAAVVFYVVGLNKPDADAPAYADGLGAPVANLPPVLLPGSPVPADVDRLRFSLGLRGYRMDQVDEVLDRLRDEIAAKDARIAALEQAVVAPPAVAVMDDGGSRTTAVAAPPAVDAGGAADAPPAAVAAPSAADARDAAHEQ